VTLFWNGQQQAQQVSGGKRFPQRKNQRRTALSGLARSPRSKKAVVRWPSGKVQTIESPAPDQIHAVKEPL